ncbi:MAG TPA: hypothetical protein QF873_01615 [Patescibacteria group bacterium]|nr:hypothetical protein [Patescibacteria group bacterium]
MNKKVFLVALAALLLPTSALGAELVVYDGDLDTAKSVMESREDISIGRDYRRLGDFVFPGLNDLWIAGATSSRECKIGVGLTNDDMEKLLERTAQTIDGLDVDGMPNIVKELDAALPCIREAVFSEQLARLHFFKGIIADFLGEDAKKTEAAFRDALAVHDMQWDESYRPDILVSFHKAKRTVDRWRAAESSQQVAVNYRFLYDDLMIDGRRDAASILPGTHLVQWSVDGKWYGRVFVIPQSRVTEITLVSEAGWHSVILHGPAAEDAGDLRIVKAFFAGMQDMEMTTVLSLAGEFPSGYVYYPSSMDPILKLEVVIQEETPDPTPTAKKQKVGGSIGVFGTYGLLNLHSYGGVSIIGHINPIAGLEIGFGGQVMFSRFKLVDYVLPTGIVGVRYVFDTPSIVGPFVGVYGLFHVQEPVVASVQGCGGVQLGLPSVRPTIMSCGGVDSLNTGHLMFRLGASF